jgi:hypothetical protein
LYFDFYFSEVIGKLTFLYFDPHPTQGFSLTHRQPGFPDSYFILTRQKDPKNLDKVIDEVLEALSLDRKDFYVKSKDFGKIQIEIHINVYII